MTHISVADLSSYHALSCDTAQGSQTSLCECYITRGLLHCIPTELWTPVQAGEGLHGSGGCCVALQQSCANLCRLVRDYMDAAPASAVADMAEMLAGPNILHMVHSHAGAQVACHVLAVGTAKQRKKVIKAMKGELSCPLLYLPLGCLSLHGDYTCIAEPFLQIVLGRLCSVLQGVSGGQVHCCTAPETSRSAAGGCQLSFTLLRRLLAGTGHVKVMSEDEWAHIVLLAALSFTDDTALLKKSIVPELLVSCSSLPALNGPPPSIVSGHTTDANVHN